MTGVSGSGKSTLVNDILYPVLAQRAHRGKGARAGKHDGVDGLDLIDKVIRIDQSPIGRTPRSNPRNLYAGADADSDFPLPSCRSRARAATNRDASASTSKAGDAKPAGATATSASR